MVVSGLSVEEHYFVCSVASHCQHGMRFTVIVQTNNNSAKITPRAQVFMLECIMQNEESGYYPVDIQFSTIGYASVSPTPFLYAPLCNASLPLNHLLPYLVFYCSLKKIVNYTFIRKPSWWYINYIVLGLGSLISLEIFKFYLEIMSVIL